MISFSLYSIIHYYLRSVENRNEAQTPAPRLVYQAPPLITLYIKYLSSSQRNTSISAATHFRLAFGFTIIHFWRLSVFCSVCRSSSNSNVRACFPFFIHHWMDALVSQTPRQTRTQNFDDNDGDDTR